MGFSVGVGVLVVIWIGIWLRRRQCKTTSPKMFRRPPPDTLDMKSLMEGGGFTTPTYEEGCATGVMYDGGNFLYDGGNLLYEDASQSTPLVAHKSSSSLATLKTPLVLSQQNDARSSTLVSLRGNNSRGLCDYAVPSYNSFTNLRPEILPPPPPPSIPPPKLPVRQTPQVINSNHFRNYYNYFLNKSITINKTYY